MVIVNGRVAMNGTCHSTESSLNQGKVGFGSEEAQMVCNVLEVTLCVPPSSTAAGGAPPTIVGLPMPPEILCSGGGVCFTPTGNRL